MPDITPTQLTVWNRFLSRLRGNVRTKAIQLINLADFAAKLQEKLDSLNVPITVFTPAMEPKIQEILDMYNRLDRSASKVEMETYGLQFENGDFHIVAPSHWTPEQTMNDEVILSETFQGIWVVVGVGLIVVGLSLKALDVWETHEKTVSAEIRKGLIELKAKQPQLGADIDRELDKWYDENKGLAKKAGLLELLFGKEGSMAVAIALGVGVLIFAFSKGRK